ncbi:hypothetical protein BV20DRAFT_796400 [Pilatotrama ljubarskyi]|nr:hypothetical protein BV20DRAFT_796400 [Pilatotrama ljubarskyi]
MKFTSRILSAAGLVVALAMGAVSQNVMTAIQSIDRVTAAFANLDKQVEQVTKDNAADKGPPIEGDFRRVVEVLQNELSFLEEGDIHSRNSEDGRSVLAAYSGLVKTAHWGMLKRLVNKRDIVPPNFVGQVGPAARTLRHESEFYSEFFRHLLYTRDQLKDFEVLHA